MTLPLSDAFSAYADRSSTFIAMLEGFSSYQAPGGGWVRYVDISGAWLGAAEPLAPTEDRARVARAFSDAGRAARRRVALLPVTEGLAAALAGSARWTWALMLSAPTLLSALLRILAVVGAIAAAGGLAANQGGAAAVLVGVGGGAAMYGPALFFLGAILSSRDATAMHRALVHARLLRRSAIAGWAAA
jgi:hypothetical protein